MDLSQLSIADDGPSESDQGNPSGASHLSPKLRDKLSKLAEWRIDPSSIEFPEGAHEFEGGHAIVSRALLAPASEARANSNNQTSSKSEPRAGDENVNRKAVAVKRLKLGSKDDRERILGLALREAGLLVGLSSGYIIGLEGFVEDLPNNRIWLIFPWHEYGNLKNFVASQDWEIPERIYLMDDVARGVEYLHTRSPPIYHGDLKSVNVLVSSKCRAIVTDFGSARRLTEKDPDTQTTRTEKTPQPAPAFQATFCADSNTMTFTGNEYTLRWAAPELLMDDELTLASDIWALGWIFYEVMTNSIPFENVKKDSMIIKHVMDGTLPSVTDHIRMSLILRLSSLMVVCWSVDPTQRPTAEGCRKLMGWMPMTVPVPEQPSDRVLPRARSPELLIKLGDIHLNQDDDLNASKFYMEALDIYEKTSNDKGKAIALLSLGIAHANRELSKAATFYSEALQIYTAIGDGRGRAEAMAGLALIYRSQRKYSEAKELFSQVIQTSIDIGDETQRANALRGLADVQKRQEDYNQAVTSYSKAVEIYTGIGDTRGRSSALAGLAEVKRRQTKHSEAIALFSESLKLSTDIGNKFGRAYALYGLADIHRSQDRLRDALCLYEEAGEIYGQIGQQGNAALASEAVADIRSRLEGLEVE